MAKRTTTRKATAPHHYRASYEGVAAHFDNARHSADMDSLFRNADSMSIVAELSPRVRRTIRDRARYVVYNCPYGYGMLDTFATHVLGTWVTVSLPSAEVPERLRDEIVKAFDAWALKVRLWSKLKVLIRAKTTDGEGFATFFTDPTIVDETNGVTLNLAPIECDRVESWTELVTRENEFDGIRFDKYGHPTEYRILKYHPGDYRAFRNVKGRAGEWVKAANVIHFFDALRPEQVRGVSDFVSALDIPALQKSYRSAVAETAINAAAISGLLHTDQVPECFDGDDASIGKCAMDVSPNTMFHMQRGAFVTLPEGWDVTQMKAEQPTTLYADFTRSLIAELARCLSMPVNIAMCDSSKHNFASAKLDHTTYSDKVDAVRETLGDEVLDRIFFKWLEEYAVQHTIAPRTLAALHQTEWLFTERRSADVMKDASADNTRLGNGTLTYETYYARDGKDGTRETRKALEERARMLSDWRKMCEQYGLPADTPCPFYAPNNSAANASATSLAPTEDEVEHDSQKNLNPNNQAKKGGAK